MLNDASAFEQTFLPNGTSSKPAMSLGSQQGVAAENIEPPAALEVINPKPPDGMQLVELDGGASS
jgi:hypothetical protein